MKNLVYIESIKLFKSPVFWVAPFVIMLFTLLMLFGYEIYAAKSGTYVEPARLAAVDAANDDLSGSVIVMSYSVLKRMVTNTVGLVISPVTNIFGKGGAGNNSSGDGTLRVLPGEIKEFNYLETLVKNLIDPSPVPKRSDDCVCDCPGGKGEPDAASGTGSDLVVPAENKMSTVRSDAAVAIPADPRIESVKENSNVSGAPAIDTRVPEHLRVSGQETFWEKVQKRLNWLTMNVQLDQMLIDRTKFNGLRYAFFCEYFAMVFMFPLIIVSVTSKMFADEFSQGTIRTSLFRATSREKFLQAKLIVLAGYTFMLVLFFIIFSLALGILVSGYGGLVLDSEMLNIGVKNSVVMGDGAVMLFLVSIPLAVLTLLPLACFSILLSLIKADSATVIGISSIVYFVLFSLGGLPLFEGIRFLFFTTYMDVWIMLFDSPVFVNGLIEKSMILLFMSLTLTIAINYILRKKDIFD